MITLTELWLAVLVAAAFVFIISSVLHMVLPIHAGDYVKMPNEDAVLESMRAHGVGRGMYRFPWCGSMADMSSPEFVAKQERGPVGTMVLLPPGPMKMGAALLQWFIFSIVVSLFVAYVASLALPRGTDSMLVFRVTSAVAVIAYAGSVTDSVWKGVPWSVSAKFVFDAILYGVGTGLAFVWLWPG